MFDNLLFQSAGDLLADDIANDKLPGALLFSGPLSSGKLTCALELARILSCKKNPQGNWLCTCQSCLQHKSLLSTNVLLAGPRDCLPEILSASHTLLTAVSEGTPYIKAARYLFVRSIRKLTMRFSQILWQDDDRLSKIAAAVSAIDEYLEELDFPRELPALADLDKICDEVEKQCQKLQSGFMYDSLPVNQVRNASAWAHLSVSNGKKVIIFENAEQMLDSVRNAMLKILEEPPSDTLFILTTARRGAIIPTILSRVRTYSFQERTKEQQNEIISRVFHDDINKNTANSISDYLQTFLPVSPVEIRKVAHEFFTTIARSGIPDIQQIIKSCCNFDPRIILKIFLVELQTYPCRLLETAAGCEVAAECADALRNCWSNIVIYNQTPAAALEQLVRTLSKINAEHSRVFAAAISA